MMQNGNLAAAAVLSQIQFQISTVQATITIP
jgi:hypothetical protein